MNRDILDNPKKFFDNLNTNEFDELLNRFGIKYDIRSIYNKNLIYMNNNFGILRLNEEIEFDYLIIIHDWHSVCNHIKSIYEILTKFKLKGRFLIDTILHSGNNSDRFICVAYDDTSNTKNLSKIHISKKNPIRKISCDYLRKNNLVDYSILTSIQKRMINKGIAI